ncbi:MAG: ABC transporter permease [Propionibacteriaceae bacterium]|nr:ABC transporter permease [Propionibacteriaceae bacterium]
MSRLLPEAVIVLLLFYCLAAWGSLEGIFIKFISDGRPIEIIQMRTDQYEKLQNHYDFTVYQDYTLHEPGIHVAPLLPREDSALAMPGMLAAGAFPENGDEVIIGADYCKDVIHLANPAAALAQKIDIQGYEFTISAVAVDFLVDNNAGEEFYAIPLYWNDRDKPIVLVPYKTLEMIGTPVTDALMSVKLPGLYDDNVYLELREQLGTELSWWDSKIMAFQGIVDLVVLVLLLAVATIAVTALIFIKNETALELYYRRKELGYLQIFGMSRKKVFWMVVTERTTRTICSFILAGVAFTVCAAVAAILGFMIWIPWYLVAVMAVVVVLYSFMLCAIPTRQFLRKDVVDLIR